MDWDFFFIYGFTILSIVYGCYCYSGNASVQSKKRFGPGTGRSYYLGPSCRGTENTMMDCPLYTGFYECIDHNFDFGVICNCKYVCWGQNYGNRMLLYHVLCRSLLLVAWLLVGGLDD